jgi:chloramphenicol 3-O-phosphotransferase
MRWVDVAGPPASGKSTLCCGTSKLTLDGGGIPAEWSAFVTAARASFREHARSRTVFDRHLMRMATRYRVSSSAVYANVAFAQHGLSLARRRAAYDVCEYFRLMPVSLGVVFLTADVDVLLERNRRRPDGMQDATRWVVAMERARALAADVLRSRGAKVYVIDTSTHTVDECRRVLGEKVERALG